jgi:2-octaprenyl-6-methoxyphenol hydroxylase
MDEIADIAIIGGGLVGAAASIVFGYPAMRGSLRVVLLERPNPQKGDARALALTLSTRRMFEVLGIWADIERAVQPLRQIVVSDWRGVDDQPELLRIEDGDAPVGVSAYFVESGIVLKALNKKLLECDHVQLMHGELSDLTVKTGKAEVKTGDGKLLAARLLIAADGKDSLTRAGSGIETISFDYPQSAIVTTIEHALPHGGRAYERFLPAGPFALLPLTGNRSSIVWTEDAKLAKRLMESTEEDFLAELRCRAGPHLGNIRLAGPRQIYPLSFMLAKAFAARRTALVGDAAHVIHPLAGLGFNLGMRDVAALAEVVINDARLGLDIGGDATLQRYQSWRRMDTLMTAAATDWLNRLFSNDNEFLRRLRDAGLQTVDRIVPLKTIFMQEAAGLTGDLPKLMKGEAL